MGFSALREEDMELIFRGMMLMIGNEECGDEG